MRSIVTLDAWVYLIGMASAIVLALIFRLERNMARRSLIQIEAEMHRRGQ